MSIRSVLSYQERYGSLKPSAMSLDEAVRFALRLLMTAAEFDSATGGVNPAEHSFATIRVLTSTGIVTIGTDQQRSALADA